MPQVTLKLTYDQLYDMLRGLEEDALHRRDRTLHRDGMVDIILEQDIKVGTWFVENIKWARAETFGHHPR